jgi:GDP-mannose transporter
MVMLNKHALASFSFQAPMSLLFFQCALAVVLVKACEMLGLIKPLQPLKRDLVLVWWASWVAPCVKADIEPRMEA